jgi:acyl carrier protein
MTEERIRNLLRRVGARSADAIGREVSLHESGTIDSFLLLELLGALETEFGIRIDNRDVTPENLDSIDRIEAFVARKRAATQ